MDMNAILMVSAKSVLKQTPWALAYSGSGSQEIPWLRKIRIRVYSLEIVETAIQNLDTLHASFRRNFLREKFEDFNYKHGIEKPPERWKFVFEKPKVVRCHRTLSSVDMERARARVLESLDVIGHLVLERPGNRD